MRQAHAHDAGCAPEIFLAIGRRLARRLSPVPRARTYEHEAEDEASRTSCGPPARCLLRVAAWCH